MPPPCPRETPAVHASCEGGIAWLVVDNPPVNAFARHVRRALREALDAATADPRAEAVVIASAGPLFSGGGDLRELGRPEPPDSIGMGELAGSVERCAKPVVAALQGKAVGGGVLLALACHARVGAADALLALPEVQLGFVPGAGGTQRLPRLVGVEAALRMVALAEPLPAAQAAAAGLLDAIAADGTALRARAAALALDIARGACPWRRTSALAVPGAAPSAALLEDWRARAQARFADRQAAQEAITLIAQAAARPFEDGLREERAAYLRLSGSAQTRALLEAFFAERAAARARRAAAQAAAQDAA